MMGNSVRGVVVRDIDGSPYSFRLTTNEWCGIEDETGLSADDIMKAISTGKLKLKAVRTIFRASLSRAHPGLSEEDAGDLMTALGLEASGNLIGEVILAGMPQEAPDTAGGKPKRTATPA